MAVKYYNAYLAILPVNIICPITWIHLERVILEDWRIRIYYYSHLALELGSFWLHYFIISSNMTVR